MSLPSRHGRSRLPSRRVVLRVLGAVLLVVVLLGTYQGVRAALALRQVQTDAQSLRSQLAQGDKAAATRSLRKIAEQSHVARSHTDNLLWTVGGWIPYLGDNFEAVQGVSRVLDDTSRSALPSALSLFAALTDQDLRTEDGRFDTAAIARLTPKLDTMGSASDAALAKLDRLGQLKALVSPVREGADTLSRQVRTLRSTARSGGTITRLLPAMLGGDGPRNYLLVVQNNAEVRATGGLPGFLTFLSARDGKLSLAKRSSALDYPILSTPVLPLSAGEQALYGDTLGEDVRDTNLTPDWPRTASLMSAMTQRRYDQHVDGVISLDPIAMAGVLRATGPISVEKERLSADNITEKLLNLPYQRFDTQDEQNGFFAATARGVFDTLLTKKINQISMVRELSDAARQRRLLVWSALPAEQEQIQGSPVAGELAAEGGGPDVGMYLNDGTAAKIQYYLDYTTSFSSLRCTSEGVQTLRSRLVLRSNVPRDVSGLSEFVTGLGKYAPKGWDLTYLRIYGPPGGSVTEIEANGKPLPIQTVEHDGRPVALVSLLIKPGEEVRVSATTETASGHRGDPVLQWTPGVRTRTSAATATSSCA